VADDQQRAEIRRSYEKAKALREKIQSQLSQYADPQYQGRFNNTDIKNRGQFQKWLPKVEKSISEYELYHGWLKEGPQGPQGPGVGQKLRAYGAKAAQGFVEAPYHTATSPVTIPYLLEQISPVHQGAAKLREYFTGKPTEPSTLTKGATAVEQGAQKLFGEGGLVPVRPWAEQKTQAANVNPLTGLLWEMGGAMGAGGAAGKIANKLRPGLFGPKPPPPKPPPTDIPTPPVVAPPPVAPVQAGVQVPLETAPMTPKTLALPQAQQVMPTPVPLQPAKVVKPVPVPVAPKPIINDELWVGIREAFMKRTGGLEPSLKGNVLVARHPITKEIVAQVDLGSPEELSKLMKAIGMIEPGGVTLGSLFGALDKPTRDLANKVSKNAPVVARGLKAAVQDTPETFKNMWRSATEHLERRQFYFRKTKEGRRISQAGAQADSEATHLMRGALYDQTDEGLKKTKYFVYDAMDDQTRMPVNRILAEGDELGVARYTRSELEAKGLNDMQIEAYDGFRDIMDKIHVRASGINKQLDKAGLHPMGVVDEEGIASIGFREGYIPRKWLDDWEIYIKDKVTGETTKHVPSNPQVGNEYGSSTFSTRFGVNWEASTLRDDPRHAGKEIIVQQFNRKIQSFRAHGVERVGEKGYEVENLQDVARQYIAQEARWEANAKFRMEYTKIREMSKDTLDPEEWGRLDRYFEKVMGKRAWLDMKADEWINKTPILKDVVKASNPTGQIMGGVRGLVTHVALGMLKPSYAIVNTMAVVQHVYPGLARYAGKLGPAKGMTIDDAGLVKQAMKGYMKGMKHRFAGGEYTPEAKLMDELVHRGIVDIQLWTESAPAISGKLLGSEKLRKGVEFAKDTSLLLGRSTEEFTRVVAAISGYNLAGRAGMNHQAALKFAQTFTDETMARFGRASKPNIYANDIGGTLGQFKTFQQTMLENMYSNTFEGNFKSAMRFWGTTIALGGVVKVVGVEAFDKIYQQATGESAIEQFAGVSRELGTGMAPVTGLFSELPGQLGAPDWNVDISGRVGYGEAIPTRPSDLTPIGVLGDSLVELLINMDPKAAVRELNVGVPFLSHYLRTDDDGNWLDSKGRIVYRPEGGQVAIEGMGFMPQERGDIYRFGSIAYSKKAEAARQRDKYYEGLSRGEQPEVPQDAGVTPEGIDKSLRSRRTPREYSIIRNAPRFLRPELAESPLRPRPTR